jgi:adenylosuccinate synthase
MVGRFNGGANAGHTVVADGVTYKFHLLPSGMLHPGCVNVIGNGCVVDIEGMFEEMVPVRKNGVDFDDRFFVSDRA